VLWAEGAHFVSGAEPDLRGTIARTLFVIAALALAWVGQPTPTPDGWRLPRASLLGLTLALGSALLYGLTGNTAAAWGAAAGWAVALLWLDRLLSAGRPRWVRAPVSVTLAILGGLVLATAAQVESGFAEEEFFVAVQATSLAAVWWLLRPALSWLSAMRPPPALRATRVSRPVLLGALGAGAAALLLGGYMSVGAYQRSFSPPAGAVAEDTEPFRCAQVAPDAERYDGAAVHARQLALLEAHPVKGAPEFGALALGSGERVWAEQFREQILREAAEGRFTGAAGSVKYGQFEAAFRVYYYDRVRAAFPGLFAPADEAALAAWFAAINRRALTVEWVDWLYALAFAQAPGGPYENQEIGAGLLAMLEQTGLADPALAAQNRDYLARQPRGWETRTRNNDDTYIYQMDWIANAYFQSLATGGPPPERLRRSLEWLMLQMPPDGSPLGYNFPTPVTPDGAALLGAQQLGDPRYLWFAGRALEGSAQRYGFTRPFPGADGPLAGAGRPPTEGSCLISAETGVPNRPGPVAPDKIVFRDGWAPDAQYALLNLRFTGWHRYKATNTLTLVSRRGTLLADQQAGASLPWLPRGRSLARDKRLAREALNGLIVPRSGMSAVAQQLGGLGGLWAQDPPFFARVVGFELRDGLDISTTALEGWRGWSQTRTIYFYHDGPIVVLDAADGPRTQRAAVVWNVLEGGALAAGAVSLDGGEAPARLVLVPLDGGALTQRPASPAGSQVRYSGGDGGRLRLASVILSGAWADAAVARVVAEGRDMLRISSQGRSVEVPLSAE